MMPMSWLVWFPMSTPFLSIFSPVSAPGSTLMLSIGSTLPLYISAIYSSEKRETSISNVLKMCPISSLATLSSSGSLTSLSRK